MGFLFLLRLFKLILTILFTIHFKNDDFNFFAIILFVLFNYFNKIYSILNHNVKFKFCLINKINY